MKGERKAMKEQSAWSVQKQGSVKCIGLALLWVLSVPGVAWGYSSGSTGEDGALDPTESQEIQLPEDGVLHYQSVRIRSGVKLTFRKNRENTPVRLLVSGDARIDGEIVVSGEGGSDTGTAGDGNILDDGEGGAGGTGGFAGGAGGAPGELRTEGNEQRAGSYGGGGGGPGGGKSHNRVGCAHFGAGGSYGSTGGGQGSCGNPGSGVLYGNEELTPLIGGSGGGGGPGGKGYAGGGGGGGGGALLLSVTGTVYLDGALRADGGTGGNAAGQSGSQGGSGGGGSGGAIKVIATRIEGNGLLSAQGARSLGSRYGTGGAGRIRLEAESSEYRGSSLPSYSTGEPMEALWAGLPSLRIRSVGGRRAPASPSGRGDLKFAAGTRAPVRVEFETLYIPEGNTVELRVLSENSGEVSVRSAALSEDSEDSRKAYGSVEVSLEEGENVLEARVSYTIVSGSANASLGGSGWLGLGELARVELRSGAGGSSRGVLWTSAGTRLELPAWALPPAVEPGS